MLAAGLLAVLGTTVPPSLGAPPTPTSLPGTARDVDVAVNAAGVAAMTWTQVSPDSTSAPTYLSTRAPGRGWGAARLVSDASAATESSQVEVARDGRVMAAWVEHHGERSRVRYRTYAANGTAGAQRTALACSRNRLTDLDLDVTPAGRAAIAVTDFTGHRPLGAVGTVAGLGPARVLRSGARGSWSPQVELSDSGDALFVWESEVGDDHLVESRAWPADAAPGPVAVVAGGAGRAARNPVLAMAPAGPAVVVLAHDAADTGPQVRYAARDVAGGFGSGGWSAVGLVSREGEATLDRSYAAVLTGPRSAVAAYTTAAGDVVTAALAAPGSAFAGHQRVSAWNDGRGGTPSLSLSPTGAVVVAFASRTRDAYSGNAAVRRSGAASFGVTMRSTAPGTTSGTNAVGALDDQGNAYIAWLTAGCTTCPSARSTLRELGYDVVAPTLTGVRAPRRLRRGVRGTLAVLGVRDRVSAVRVRWQFGDGTSAAGATVRKAWRQRGARTVTVVLTDAAGNTTRRSVLVRVTG
ncbi:PKD domain-containing protein [Nocardioides sp. SYSU D00038]|uniref:PKD domain-containing protein n=1 Tax=Nocardioides sp. SYSU D00038 TaxID=2812554 RepID=UPI00196855D8|nr:PKD domain-containing protein [Nocardioides sp. SYSU D00038]